MKQAVCVHQGLRHRDCRGPSLHTCTYTLYCQKGVHILALKPGGLSSRFISPTHKPCGSEQVADAQVSGFSSVKWMSQMTPCLPPWLGEKQMTHSRSIDAITVLELYTQKETLILNWLSTTGHTGHWQEGQSSYLCPHPLHLGSSSFHSQKLLSFPLKLHIF